MYIYRGSRKWEEKKGDKNKINFSRQIKKRALGQTIIVKVIKDLFILWLRITCGFNSKVFPNALQNENSNIQ